MVMGQFVTTYRKDYLWPYVKTLGLKWFTNNIVHSLYWLLDISRPEPEQLYQPKLREENSCPCNYSTETRPTNQQVTLFGPDAYGDEQWSRLGPMGPLLEPKIFSAKVSAPPESQVSRYNQPNVFLQKVRIFNYGSNYVFVCIWD